MYVPIKLYLPAIKIVNDLISFYQNKGLDIYNSYVCAIDKIKTALYFNNNSKIDTKLKEVLQILKEHLEK